MDWLKMSRDGMAVKRNHTWMTHSIQSVGEHTANVLCILLRLIEEPSLNLIKATLFHDLAEQATGDAPATIKIADGAVKAALDMAEAKFNREWDLDVPLQDHEKWALKFADMFEFAMYCKEELQLGNTHAHSRYLRALNICKIQLANAPDDRLWQITDNLIHKLEAS